MDDVDRDNERHRREQQELRAKRKVSPPSVSPVTRGPVVSDV